MLLTITTTHQPATDLGYLLHKNPYRAQAFRTSFGKVYVFYPEAHENRCSASLLLDLDLIGLIHRQKNFYRRSEKEIPYISDRPYVASTFLSSAISQVLGTAMLGQSRERPELAQQELPFEIELSLLPPTSEELLHQLFLPLGYEIEIHYPFRETTPSSTLLKSYLRLHLRGKRTLSQVLSHLYVLIPVLDDEKFLWFRDFELEKFLRQGESWLKQHPEEKRIVQSYFRKNQNSGAFPALSRILGQNYLQFEKQEEQANDFLKRLEDKLQLRTQRFEKVKQTLQKLQVTQVLQLQSGEGLFLKELLETKAFEEILGMDTSSYMLEKSRQFLRLEEDSPHRLRLIHGSLFYRDKYLKEWEAVVLLESLQFFLPHQFKTFEDAFFGFVRPRILIVTTPNREYNALLKEIPEGKYRHPPPLLRMDSSRIPKLGTRGGTRIFLPGSLLFHWFRRSPARSPHPDGTLYA
jgi:3' terminal RNA ribose 2'-O-methyltransferase Hen1